MKACKYTNYPKKIKRAQSWEAFFKEK